MKIKVGRNGSGSIGFICFSAESEKTNDDLGVRIPDKYLLSTLGTELYNNRAFMSFENDRPLIKFSDKIIELPVGSKEEKFELRRIIADIGNKYRMEYTYNHQEGSLLIVLVGPYNKREQAKRKRSAGRKPTPPSDENKKERWELLYADL